MSPCAWRGFLGSHNLSGGVHASLSSWLQAWKKRWFVLRSGRMSGDPDVLEYYKNDHSKKPLRVINLNFCEQVDAGLTFNKKELQDSYIFDIKTSDRTFYLVAETEDDMNKWVRSICQICGFNQSEENTGTMRAVSVAKSISCSVLPTGPSFRSDLWEGGVAHHKTGRASVGKGWTCGKPRRGFPTFDI